MGSRTEFHRGQLVKNVAPMARTILKNMNSGQKTQKFVFMTSLEVYGSFEGQLKVGFGCLSEKFVQRLVGKYTSVLLWKAT